MGFNKSNEDLKLMVHPYQFALTSGPSYDNDFLDYSLMMVHVGSPETIRSPHTPGRPTTTPVAEIPLPNPKTSLEKFRQR